MKKKIQLENEKIIKIEKELELLKYSIERNKKPWYLSPSIIISILALLFSFSTTYFSFKRDNQNDIQNNKNELRKILQRVTILPKENLDLVKEYSDDGSGKILLSGLVNQENLILTRQALDLMNSIPKERITSTEYYSLGMAFINSNNYTEALDLINSSIETATDLETELAARRIYANLLFNNGDTLEGRKEFANALNIFSKYDNNFHQTFVTETHLLTEFNWARTEYSYGSMKYVLDH